MSLTTNDEWLDQLLGLVGNMPGQANVITTGTSFELADATEYHLGEVASLAITFPNLTSGSRLNAKVCFTSGLTPTNLTWPQDCVWYNASDLREDTDFHEFSLVPEPKTRYTIFVWFDGAKYNADVYCVRLTSPRTARASLNIRKTDGSSTAFPYLWLTNNGTTIVTNADAVTAAVASGEWEIVEDEDE